MSGPVVVVQPVHQHAYETAAAAQQAGLLGAFVTGIYDTGRGWSHPRLRAALPERLRSRVDRELRRRRHPELDPARVVTIARYHALATAWRRAGGRRDLDTWAHERFDRAAARALRRLRSARLVHGFEGSCLATLAAAKREGAATVLDAPNAHEWALEATGLQLRAHTERIRAERALADYVFAPSAFVVECLREHGVPSEQIVEIPYGVDPEQFAPAERTPDGTFRVLFVGRIGARKGVSYLLEAWRRLALPRAELVLVGAPDETGRKLLRRYDGCFRWAGTLPKYEVHRWFRASDVFAFPSLAEGSAYVTYEAMACGLPVVTTPNSGSVVRDGLDGFLVPTRDVDALCERISLLHADEHARRELGARARARIEAGYTWRHYRRRVAAAHAAILAGRPVQPAVDREVPLATC